MASATVPGINPDAPDAGQGGKRSMRALGSVATEPDHGAPSTRTFACRTDGCGRSYSAQVPESPVDWTDEHWGLFESAQSAHVRAHPDSLKTQGGPDPRAKRDWVGCRCRGTCRCRGRRV